MSRLQDWFCGLPGVSSVQTLYPLLKVDPAAASKQIHSVSASKVPQTDPFSTPTSFQVHDFQEDTSQLGNQPRL